jgi:hypothetical protein
MTNLPAPELNRTVLGQRALSDQWIWQGMIAKSVAVSQQNADEAQEILKTSGNRSLTINAQLDVYDHETPEILLFEDGIQVKRQKTIAPPQPGRTA